MHGEDGLSSRCISLLEEVKVLLENENDSGEQCIKIMQVFRIFHRGHPLAQIVVHDVSETKGLFI